MSAVQSLSEGKPAPVRSLWIDNWPTYVILAGFGATLLWIGLLLWLVWSAVEGPIG
jgi:hypothetical protein